MEFYDDNHNTYELTHWGIKGMKWGVRRFQNKDGSLTDAGGKRYNGSDYQPKKLLGQKISDYKKASQRKANLKKAREARAAKKEAEEKAKAAAEQRKKDVESGKIKAKDMTNEELNDRINRLNNEKRYKQLMEETDHNSKLASYGKQFADKLMKDAITPAVTEAGKQIIKDRLIDAYKLPKSESEKLAQLAKDWENKSNIAKYKKSEFENTRDLEAIKLKAKKGLENLKNKDNESSKDKDSKQNNKTESNENSDKISSKIKSKADSWKEASQNVKKEEQKDYEKYQNAKNEAAKKAETERSYEEYKKAKTVTGEVIGKGNGKYSNTPQGEQYYVKNPSWNEMSSSTKTTLTKALNKYGQTSTSSQNYEVQVREGKDIVDNVLNNMTPSTAFNKPKWNED